MQKVDTAELRRLHEAATKGEWQVHPNPRYWVLLPTDQEGDSNSEANAAFVVAAHNALPALLDELEAARLEMRRQGSVIWELRQEVREVQNGAALQARDRRMKAIGAAEELERSAQTLREDLADMNPPEFTSRGKVAPGYCECLQDVADGMEERAAKLRQEAEAK